MIAPTLGHREWLRAAVALACVPFVPAAARGGTVDELIQPELDETARRLGERCRAAGVLADESALLAGNEGKSRAELGAFPAAKARADFTAGRLVAIGPWWLAETEARVLALL